MAVNTFKCNYLTPLHFKGLRVPHVGCEPIRIGPSQ